MLDRGVGRVPFLAAPAVEAEAAEAAAAAAAEQYERARSRMEAGAGAIGFVLGVGRERRVG